LIETPDGAANIDKFLSMLAPKRLERQVHPPLDGTSVQDGIDVTLS